MFPLQRTCPIQFADFPEVSLSPQTEVTLSILEVGGQ